MKDYTLDAEAKTAKTEYRFKLHFYVFEDSESNAFVAYCPSLDLTTSGGDYTDAVRNFYECFQLYAECCIEQGTLLDDLRGHGWKVGRGSARPPSFSALARKSEFSQLLSGDIPYQMVVVPMRLDVPAQA